MSKTYIYELCWGEYVEDREYIVLTSHRNVTPDEWQVLCTSLLAEATKEAIAKDSRGFLMESDIMNELVEILVASHGFQRPTVTHCSGNIHSNLEAREVFDAYIARRDAEIAEETE